ncbi:hypothetical protein B1B_07705, partial [mine drainage metagenome]
MLAATLEARRAIGTCYVFDPTSDIALPEGACELRWSPITGCEDHDVAESMAYALAVSARPGSLSSEAQHWVDQCRALFSPILQAAA